MRKETTLINELSIHLFGRKIWLYKYIFADGTFQYYFNSNANFAGLVTVLLPKENINRIVGIINKIAIKNNEHKGESILMEVEVSGKIFELPIQSMTDVIFFKK